MSFATGLKSCLVMIILVVCSATALRAEDEPAVVKALYDTFAELGGERPSHDTLTTGADGTITIIGLKILMSNFQQDGEDVRQDLTAEKVVMKDIKPLDEGLFEVGTMTMNNWVVSVSTPTIVAVNMSVPVIEMSGAIIRSPGGLKTPLERWVAQQVLARSATVPLMTITVGDWSIDAHDMTYGWTGDAKTGIGEWVYSVGSIELPASLLADAGGSPSMSELGYQSIVLGMTGRSALALEGEFLAAEFDSRFLAREMGAIAIVMAVGGIQPALIDAAQAIREAPNAIDINAMMAMLQSIKIDHLMIRYDDASLAERLLAYMEKKEGKTRDEIISEAVGVADFGMMAVNSPDLAKQAKAALETFLRKPGWIQFELRPAAPVPISQLMPLLGTPAEIVKLMNITITAGPATAAQ